MFQYDSYTFYFSKHTFRTSIKLCCCLEQVGSASPRRDKHTPCIKTNRLKGKIAAVRNGPFALNRLANRPVILRTAAYFEFYSFYRFRDFFAPFCFGRRFPAPSFFCCLKSILQPFCSHFPSLQKPFKMEIIR